MTDAAAIQAFLAGFSIPAMASTAVPADQPYPYLTYDLPTGEWAGGELTITVDLYYYGDSEAVPNAKAREIRTALGMGGVQLATDHGTLWLKRGSPFSQPWPTERDKVKARRINIDVEYQTVG